MTPQQDDRLPEIEVKKRIDALIKTALEEPFVTDRDEATKVLARAFHSIVRNGGYNIFLDDIYQYLQEGKDIKKVY